MHVKQVAWQALELRHVWSASRVKCSWQDKQVSQLEQVKQLLEQGKQDES